MTDAPVKIEVFTDYVCPWCYLSSAAVEKLEAEHSVDIEWIPFPLHPSTPPEGLLLSELFGGRDMSGAQAQLQARIDAAGLEYNYCDRTFNTRLAQELGKWANSQPGGKAIHKALYRAYFVEGKNLAERDVLLDVAESVGLDRSSARKVIEERSFSDQVDADWQRARSHQISGVPCFVSEGYMAAGAQPYEELERFYQYAQSRANMA